MTVYQKLNNITYPFNLPGKYTFTNKNEALSVIHRNHELLSIRGSFIATYPASDPNSQQLAASINYYLFDICNKESDSLKRLKRYYLYYQKKMFIQEQDFLTLKGLCRITIRKQVALKLNLLKKNNIIRPLLVINKNYISWKPELKYLLEKTTIGIPKTLQEYIQLSNLNSNIFLTT
tara:strand:+ start:209 stop:739 length:531 start_codon:yes stop_codon:yes gene_type:complete